MVDVWHTMIGTDRNPFYRDGGPKERGGCRGREKARKRKREGSGLDITMIAGDEKKGSGCEACSLRRANATSLSDGN